MARLARILLMIGFATLCTNLFAATIYYIDCVNGSDSNNGTSETTPWQHAPGMTGVVNNVGPGKIDDAAGDKCGSSPCSLPGTEFIFRGGVTCGMADWPMTMRLTGTGPVIGTSAVYFGVNQTWYAGTSWARPIFNFGGSNGPKCSPMVQFAPVQYAIFDNIEFTGLYWDHTCNGDSNGSISYLATNGTASGGSFNELTNLYLHGWSHEAYLPNKTADGCDLISGTTQGTDRGSVAYNNVIDGADVDNGSGYSCVAFWGSPPTLYNNYITDVANGFVGFDPVDFHQNTCSSLGASYDTTQHTQCWESNSDNGVVFYNNLIQNSTTLGMVVNISTVSGATSYIWNNIIWNVVNNSNILVFSYPAGGASGGTFYAFNNTIEGGIDGSNPSSLLIGCLSNQQGCHYRNNQMISSANSAANCPSNCTQDHNIFQTQTQANTQGYFGTSTYPFSEVAGGSTIGAGANLTSTTPGCGTSGLSALCTDTTVGVGLDTSSYTVLIPNRTALGRSGSAVWDSSGYYMGGGPSAPTNLTATVH
jgi:hypothetical protein